MSLHFPLETGQDTAGSGDVLTHGALASASSYSGVSRRGGPPAGLLRAYVARGRRCLGPPVVSCMCGGSEALEPEYGVCKAMCRAVDYEYGAVCRAVSWGVELWAEVQSRVQSHGLRMRSRVQSRGLQVRSHVRSCGQGRGL